MKIKATIKAFTLIELLVVITIIGILATGAVGVFTKQLQGARDSTRINDLKLLETANNLYFSDNDVYPDETDSGVYLGKISQYMSKKLSDPKQNQTVCWNTGALNNQPCQGVYDRFADTYNLANTAYKIGIYFEKVENYNELAKTNGKKTDGGNIDNMYEVFAGAGANTGSLTVGVNSTDPKIVY